MKKDSKHMPQEPEDEFGEVEDFKLLKESEINYPTKWRDMLPSTRDKYHFSLIAFLRTTIGKDLTKVPMPVCFNEPLSFLQRLAEDVEYAQLLNKAADSICTVDRLAYVAAFASSNFANIPGRFWKPFNPLLGETFEFHHKEHGYSVIAEQVSHHPPISAIHVESDKWVFWQEYKLDTRFRGMYVKICPTGDVHLEFKSDNVHYSWKKPVTTIHNIVFGQLWLDHDGTVEITSRQAKETASVNFRPYKKVGKDFVKLTGTVTDKNGDIQYQLEGNWMEYLHAKSVEGTNRTNLQMWEYTPKPEYSKSMFGLTKFAIHLNERNDDIKCPTDSRLRPDQRMLEEGLVDEASDEKYRLEEKQRTSRKKREHNKEVWKPSFFTLHKDEDTEVYSHVYKGGYWKAKIDNNYSNLPDIF